MTLRGAAIAREQQSCGNRTVAVRLLRKEPGRHGCMGRRAGVQTGTESYWIDSASIPTSRSIDRDLDADVVVVGGGITGLTTAYLLAESGKSVVVLERGRCGQVDTGHTTAHVSMVTDARLTDLVDRVGRSHAQAVWDAGLAAAVQIDGIV